MDVPQATSDRMRAVRGRDTKPEMALRRELHLRGRRYFVDRAVLAGSRSRPDIVFPRKKIAVFVDGCFWHGCPIHATLPKTNSEWWAEKLARNIARDRDNDSKLRSSGWLVLRIWEHMDPREAADRVEATINSMNVG